jgi:hypothetical protein
MSNQFIRATGALELQFSPGDRVILTRFKEMPLTFKPSLRAPLGTTICDPIGPVPAAYGQAPFSAMSSLMNDAIKAIPDFSGGQK